MREDKIGIYSIKNENTGEARGHKKSGELLRLSANSF